MNYSVSFFKIPFWAVYRWLAPTTSREQSLYVAVTLPGDQPMPERGSLFSDVFRAKLRKQTVCAKRLRIFEDPVTRQRIHEDIADDAIKWRKFKHDSIAPFLGLDKNIFAPMLAVVTYWYEQGNILSYLKNNKTHTNLITLILEVAEGLAYLHREHEFVHGDIRCANVLINDQGHAQIADYGLVTYADAAMSRMAVPGNRYGGGRWSAPELHYPEKFDFESYKRTLESDVFAFGMFMLEVYTERPPFANIPHDASVYFKIVQDERPLKPTLDQCPRGGLPSDKLWALVNRCWKPHPRERPPMNAVVHELKEISMV